MGKVDPFSPKGIANRMKVNLNLFENVSNVSKWVLNECEKLTLTHFASCKTYALIFTLSTCTLSLSTCTLFSFTFYFRSFGSFFTHSLLLLLSTFYFSCTYQTTYTHSLYSLVKRITKVKVLLPALWKAMSRCEWF